MHIIFTTAARTKCKIWLSGRVVKAIDSKSIGKIPRRFESCGSRKVFFSLFSVNLLDIRGLYLIINYHGHRKGLPCLSSVGRALDCSS